MTRLRVMWATVILTLAFAGALTYSLAEAQPEVTETNVENGDVLDAAPDVFHMCFSEPVNNEDISSTGEDETDDATPRPWAFNVKQPDGTPLGLRIVFEADGDCVDVFPGLPEEPPDGVWTFDWLVESQESGEQTSGLVTFRVGPGEPPDQSSASTDEGDGIGTSLIIGIVAGFAAAAVVTTVVVVRGRRRTQPEDGSQ